METVPTHNMSKSENGYAFIYPNKFVSGLEKLGSKYTFIVSINNLDERHAANLEKVHLIIAD